MRVDLPSRLLPSTSQSRITRPRRSSGGSGGVFRDAAGQPDGRPRGRGECSARKDIVELELQPLKQRRSEGVRAAEGVGELEHPVPLPMDGDGLGHRVDHPVLEHAVSAVEVVLLPPVAVGRGLGDYFDHKVGRSPCPKRKYLRLLRQ